MYKPKFNHVLVEIDDKAAKWGKSDDGNIGGEVYREGTLLEVADEMFPTSDHAQLDDRQWLSVLASINDLVGKQVMWNEGHEAGTIFEHQGKKYAQIYWQDINGEKI